MVEVWTGRGKSLRGKPHCSELGGGGDLTPLRILRTVCVRKRCIDAAR